MNGIKSIVFACALAALITMPDTGHSQAGQSQLVNPDLASEKEILALPHMTAALAKSIMEQRPFLSMADLNTLLSQDVEQGPVGRALRQDVRADQSQHRGAE